MTPPLEFYSETNYVPQYGLLTESQLRFLVVAKEKAAVYVGAALQRQDKTESSQDKLYDKNRVMATLGARWNFWWNFSAMIEARTEERSRGGLFVGDIWQYQLGKAPLFSEFYAESFVFPSFHNDPVTTVWFKQGLRFHLVERVLLDPYVELYATRSPSPDLGRNAEQGRAGLRIWALQAHWNAGLLVYESFPFNGDSSHMEALLVLGGRF